MNPRLLPLILLLFAGCLSPTPVSVVPTPEPEIRVIAHHGWAMIVTDVEADQINVFQGDDLVFREKFPTNETRIPFLEPRQDYRAIFYQNVQVPGRSRHEQVEVASVEFTTPANPRAYSISPGVQPGMDFIMATGSCTLGFLARDAHNESLYGLTAGHCVSPNETVYVSRGGIALGTTVLRNETMDWAIIRLDQPDSAAPSVLGRGGPTGLREAGQADRGELLCAIGQSMLAIAAPQRCGPYLYQNGVPYDYQFANGIPVYSGDSGGPVIHNDTGQALGILIAVGFGIFAQSILDQATVQGLELRLLTDPSVVPSPLG